MSDALRWYLVVQVLSLAAFVLAAPAFRRLADGGYAASKALGILLCGATLWSGTAVGVLRNEAGGAWLSLVALATAAVLLTRRWMAEQAIGWRDVVPNARVVVVVELLFGATFVGWCLVRAYDPAVSHTEQPMDLMLLTAAFNAPTFPPQDPWLAGYPISYYYFGYWLLSTLAHLSSVAPPVAYNVGQACWFALLAVTCFGLAYNVAHAADTTPRRHVTALFAGLISAFIVALTSNLSLPVELIQQWVNGGGSSLLSESWWWWRSSRVVHDVALTGQPIEVITEFPFFSYVLGDNHPHVLGMPFVALVFTLAFSVLTKAQEPRREWQLRALLIVVALAALIPLNTWDVPGALLVVLLVLIVRPLAGQAIRTGRGSRFAILAMILAAAIIGPFLLTAQSQVRGVLPNLFHPTAMTQFAIMFGTLVPGLIIAVRLGWIESRPSVSRMAMWIGIGVALGTLWLVGGGLWMSFSDAGRRWIAEVASGVSSPLNRALQRWLVGWPVAAVLLILAGVLAALLDLRKQDSRPKTQDSSLNPGVTFLLSMAIVGVVLAIVPEFVYAHDVFTNRMNTVFKFFYQAWLVLGVVSGVALALAWRRGAVLRALSVAAGVVLIAGCIYPPVAIWSKTRETDLGGPTLDAVSHLRHFRPDEFAAVEWLQSHTRVTDVIAQAAGDSYQPDDGRVSVMTARPTLLGWQGHESQWRGSQYDAMANGRTEALTRIYNAGSDEDLARVLSNWNVGFVYVSGRERGAYAMRPEHEARLERVMELGFTRGSVRVYRRRG